MPPTSNAAAGTPNLPASGPIRPNGSGHKLGTTSRSASLNAARSSWGFIQPDIRTLSLRSRDCARRAFSCNSARSGPSPMRIKSTCEFSAAATDGIASSKTSTPLRRVIRPANIMRQVDGGPFATDWLLDSPKAALIGGGSLWTRSGFAPLATTARRMWSDIVTIAEYFGNSAWRALCLR